MHFPLHDLMSFPSELELSKLARIVLFIAAICDLERSPKWDGRATDESARNSFSHFAQTKLFAVFILPVAINEGKSVSRTASMSTFDELIDRRRATLPG